MSIASIAPLFWAQVKSVVMSLLGLSSICAHQTEANRYQMITTTVDTYSKMDITFTGDFETGKLSFDQVNNRIVHTGATTTYFFNACATIDEADTVNTKVHICLHKNDLIVERAIAYGLLKAINPNPDAQNLNAASGVTMADGDYVEVWAKADNANATFYCNHMQLQFQENLAITLG